MDNSILFLYFTLLSYFITVRKSKCIILSYLFSSTGLSIFPVPSQYGHIFILKHTPPSKIFSFNLLIQTLQISSNCIIYYRPIFHFFI